MPEDLKALAIEEALDGQQIGEGESETCRSCDGALWQGQPATIHVSRSTGDTRWEILGIWCAACAPIELEASTLGVEEALVEIHVALGSIDQLTWTQVARPDVIDVADAYQNGRREDGVDAVLIDVEGER